MITAMQMMLDDLISKREVYENAKMYQCVATLETSIELAEYLLEKEKEQINVSFISGCIEALSYQTPVRDRIKEGYFEDKAEKYFNYTYKNQTP
jgi:hypothetical protein